jgi:hypothetical protein
MDHRHKPPIISLQMHVDWSNPLLYWFVGWFGGIGLLVLLAALMST